MHSSYHVGPQTYGYVRVRNEHGHTVEAKNLVVYNGGDILAQLLAGNCQYRISHMYFGFENTAGAPTPAPADRSDTADSAFHSLSAPQDFVIGQTLEPAVLEAADPNHLYNRVLFHAIANALSGVNGLPFSAANDSKVFSLGLISSPTGAYLDDVLYAHFILPTALPVVGSGQISASWATEAD